MATQRDAQGRIWMVCDQEGCDRRVELPPGDRPDTVRVPPALHGWRLDGTRLWQCSSCVKAKRRSPGT